MGWLVAWKCLVACLFFEESQQPTCPHSRQRRKCTQVSPVFKQSSHPFALGLTWCMWSRCVHCEAKIYSFMMQDNSVADERYDAFVSICGFFPSMSNNALNALPSANAEAVSITTRKLVTRGNTRVLRIHSAHHRCRQGRDAYSHADA